MSLSREQFDALRAATYNEQVKDLDAQYSFTLARLAYEAGQRDERERCAKVCDEKARRNFNWASENADRYHIQAEWAAECAKAIRANNQQQKGE